MWHGAPLELTITALLVVGCAASDRVLIPAGANVFGREDRTERCVHHRVLVMRTTQESLEAWAVDLGLACEPDGGAPCTHWSKGATGENFWRTSRGVLDGFDSLDARLQDGVLRVDHGDYTCAAK